jgi:hypothetical protein
VTTQTQDDRSSYSPVLPSHRVSTPRQEMLQTNAMGKFEFVDFPIKVTLTLFNLAGESLTQRSEGAITSRGVHIPTNRNRTNASRTQDRTNNNDYSSSSHSNVTRNAEMTFQPRVPAALSAQSTALSFIGELPEKCTNRKKHVSHTGQSGSSHSLVNAGEINRPVHALPHRGHGQRNNFQGRLMSDIGKFHWNLYM